MARTDLGLEFKGDFQLLMREHTNMLNVGQKIFHIMYCSISYCLHLWSNQSAAAQTLNLTKMPGIMCRNDQQIMEGDIANQMFTPKIL